MHHWPEDAPSSYSPRQTARPGRPSKSSMRMGSPAPLLRLIDGLSELLELHGETRPDDWLPAMVDITQAQRDHYWSLVGKLSVTIGLPVSVPILLGFFWLGQVSSRVDGLDRSLSHQVEILGGLVTLAGRTDERETTSALEIDKLRTKVDSLIERAKLGR